MPFNLYTVFALIFSIIAAAGFIFYQGVTHCRATEMTATIKGYENHDKIEKKVMSLSDVDLRKRFCQRVRNNRKKCLQADIPIGE